MSRRVDRVRQALEDEVGEIGALDVQDPRHMHRLAAAVLRELNLPLAGGGVIHKRAELDEPACGARISTLGVPCSNSLPCPIHGSPRRDVVVRIEVVGLPAQDNVVPSAPAGWYVERDGIQQPVAELILQRDRLGEALAEANRLTEQRDAELQHVESSLGKVREQLMLALRERDAVREQLMLALRERDAEREHVEKLREQAATARRERDEAIARHAKTGRELEELRAKTGPATGM